VKVNINFNSRLRVQAWRDLWEWVQERCFGASGVLRRDRLAARSARFTVPRARWSGASSSRTGDLHAGADVAGGLGVVEMLADAAHEGRAARPAPRGPAPRRQCLRPGPVGRWPGSHREGAGHGLKRGLADLAAEPLVEQLDVADVDKEDLQHARAAVGQLKQRGARPDETAAAGQVVDPGELQEAGLAPSTRPSGVWMSTPSGLCSKATR